MTATPVHQRARGSLRLSFKRRGGATVLDGLRQEGCLKARFPRTERGAWPGAVRTWTNVTSVGDIVADGFPLAPVFGAVAEARVDNGHRAHEPEPYLCARETGAAIANALSAARRDRLP